MVNSIFERLEQLRLLHNLDVVQMSTVLGLDTEGYEQLAENSDRLTLPMLITLHNKLQASANYLLLGIEPILIEFNSMQLPKTREELDSIKMHIQNLRDQIKPV